MASKDGTWVHYEESVEITSGKKLGVSHGDDAGVSTKHEFLHP